jgi:nicotinamidase-related amidase
MMIDASRSTLLVIDMQEKTLPLVIDPATLVENAASLVRAAQRLEVPVAATEHCAKNAGATVAAIRALLPTQAIGAKSHFSAVSAQCLDALPGADRPQVVICGVEAHVAVRTAARSTSSPTASPRAAKPTVSSRSRACGRTACAWSRARWSSANGCPSRSIRSRRTSPASSCARDGTARRP